MASTSLIRPLQVSGGTMYTLSSASEDLTRALQSDTKKFRFSHYALLDVPNIDTPSFGKNNVQFDTIDGAWNEQTASAELNLVQSFQNYVLNFETMLNNRTEFDPTDDRTVSEKVFWKWLKELGVIRWKDATAEEKASFVTDPRYVELADDSTSNDARYSKIVKYVGRVDMKNAVKSSANTYEEVFVFVPTEHGNTPTVLFKTEDTVNYPSGLTLRNNPGDPLEIEFIVGRGPDDIHPAGLSMEAFFDDDGAAIPATINGVPGTIYTYSEDNSYCTESTFTNTAVETIVKSTVIPSKTRTYLRSRLDGVMLDFDEKNLKDFEANPSFKSFADYNASDKSSNFDFNTVLLYYEVYDPADPSITTTNLYGILFINPVELVSGGASQIQRLNKIKPNKVTKSGGTSYALRFNMKISASLDQVISEVTVNDFSTVSMTLFIESMNNMLKAAQLIETQTDELIVLNQKVLDLEDLIATGTDVNRMKVEVDALKQSVLANQALFDNSQDIIQMIENLQKDLDQLIQGVTPIDITLDLDAMKPGFGISFDRSIPRQLTISASSNGYVVTDSVQNWPTSGPLVHKLKRGNNLLILRSLLPTLELSDRFIRIDDTTNQWVAGQVLRVSVGFDLDMNGSALYILTDALGITDIASTPWTNVVAQLSEEQMRRWTFDNSIQHDSLFDVICLVPPSITGPGSFHIDKLR